MRHDSVSAAAVRPSDCSPAAADRAAVLPCYRLQVGQKAVVLEMIVVVVCCYSWECCIVLIFGVLGLLDGHLLDCAPSAQLLALDQVAVRVEHEHAAL